ncbi:cupredoxin domain-containing protein [Pelagibius marinus]|uniref:cupredoxin domain-containing protein n=1 Tax=Pelagibius marinus TaxID=2762760 RepID=UPI001872D28A|nr:cupredoxin family protein [Pelagibius marinus]
MRIVLSKAVLALLAAAALSTSGSALAAGSHSGGHGHDAAMSFGQPAKPTEADRTVEIDMNDSHFEPKRISVHPGETVRFVVTNAGELLHEFNIGTAAMHAAHQEEMMAMMDRGAMTATGINYSEMGSGHGAGMGHDDPNSVLLEPGETGELVWKFSGPMDLEFACNVPGHYEADMHGEVVFTNPPNAGS